MARKGQAAMEYLMTYGWALLVIVIVIAILLVILGRMVKGTPDCTFESAGFVCNQPTPPQIRDCRSVFLPNGKCLYFVFQHTLNEPINITKITFVEGNPDLEALESSTGTHIFDNCVVEVGTLRPVKIAPRQQVTFRDIVPTAPCSGLPVKKYNPATGRCEIDTALQKGSQVRGTLCIWFTRPSTTALGVDPAHAEEVECASVIANVEE